MALQRWRGERENVGGPRGFSPHGSASHGYNAGAGRGALADRLPPQAALAGKMPARAGGTPALPRNIDMMRSVYPRLKALGS
jgi:hypothetical protein